MHAAAQIHQAIRPRDQGSQDIGRDHIDRQYVPPGIDPGVVDDRIHPAEPVHLVGDALGLPLVRQVADHHHGAPVHQVLNRVEPLTATHMEHDPVAVGEQRCGCRLAQPVGRARDEDSRHA